MRLGLATTFLAPVFSSSSLQLLTRFLCFVLASPSELSSKLSTSKEAVLFERLVFFLPFKNFNTIKPNQQTTQKGN